MWNTGDENADLDDLIFDREDGRPSERSVAPGNCLVLFILPKKCGISPLQPEGFGI